MTTNKQILESYDYKLVTRAEFETACDVPKGLRERAAALSGEFVIYDPLDDDEGYLLIGNDAEALAAECVADKELGV